MSNTNLPRVTQKIFAENSTDKIGQFGSAKNGTPFRTGDISQIQALTAWGQGWSGAVVSNRNYPPLEEMTGVQKVITQQLAYYFQKGFPEWDANTAYYKNVSFCQVDGVVYQSLTDDNLGNNPTIDTANWTKWNPAEGTYANTDLSNLSEAGQAILNSKLNNTMVSNTLLGATNGNITTNEYTAVSYVNQGCTVSETNVVSSFSESNYILLSKTMTDAVNFTLEIPFNLTSTVGTQYIAQINNEENAIGVENGFLILTYDGNKETGTIALQPNIDYTLQLARNASNKTYTLSLKTTGDYTTHITLNSTSGFYADKSIYLGGGSANFLQGTINLAEVTITEESSDYWNINTTSDFQTVTVSGQFNVLMPNGLNSDNTLKNENLTLDINKTLIYSPGGNKTVLLKNDGEVMIRKDYVVSGIEPQNLELSGVWYDNLNNIMNEQSILYSNLQLVNPTGEAPTITNGILNITANGQYGDMAGTVNLGNNWNLTLNLTAKPTIDNSYILGDVNISNDGTITPSGIALQYNDGNITAYFRRKNVTQVSKTVVTSTAYIVSKEVGTVAGFVAIEGEADTYVAVDTPVYSDQTMQTLIENAEADTWTYSGQSLNNTETTIGYVKESGVQENFVPPSTQVYTDANCTTTQAVATGTDYIYNASTAVSIIGTLTAAYSNTITMSYDGTQYVLLGETLSSTDEIINGCNITLGGAAGVSSAITGIDLNTSEFSFWKWNGSSIDTPNFTPFIGAKIGEIKDNGSSITSTKINRPLVLTDNNLSNLTEEGEKHFLNKTQLTNRILEAPNGTAEYSNVGLTGTAVVEDGILSGISSSSSAIIQSFQPGSNTWEAFFKVTTGSDTSVWSRIAMLNRTPNKYGGIHFGFQGGKFAWWMSTNGTSFNLANGQSGTHSIQSNTTYWVKVNWDGTKYTLAYSLTGDADSFVTDITKTSSTPLAFHPDSPEYAQIGTGAGAGAAGSMASIDLNSSYIKVNDEIWWEFNGTNPNQVVLKEGLKLLSAVGRNSDGTLNSTEYTLSEDIPCTVSSSDVGYKYIALDTSSSDVTVYENYFSQEETPEVSNAVWFKPSENRFYVSDAEGEFSQANIALFQVFKDKYGFFKGLYPDTAVNLATMDNVDGDWEVNQVVNLAYGSSIPVNINAGGTVYTYDVSNYFPDDGCEYEIALSIEINNSAFVICYFWYPQTNNTITFAKGGNPTGGAMTAIVGLDRQIKISVVSSQAAQMWLNIDARKRLARKGA